MNGNKITLALLLLAASLFAKPTYLPPLELKSVASDDVRTFLEEEQKYPVNSAIKKKVARDVLGRIKQTAENVKDEAYYVMRHQKTLDVYVSPISKSREIKFISGRYEVSKNGEKFYWLDDARISEEAYFDNVVKRREYFVPEELYRASLTASEIEALLEGAEPVFIDIVRKPIRDSYTNYSVIFSYSEISSHAHSNSYKGQGVGIYFDEDGCSDPVGYDSSYYQLLNTCTNGIQMHPTAVAKILSETAPMAMLYAHDGDGDVSYVNGLDMDSYNPSIEISSHSWHYSSNGSYTSTAKIFDNYIYNNRLITFASAGNIKDTDTATRVGSPALAFNTIAVGAVVDPYSNNYEYSKWRNPVAHNQKPEAANFAEFYFPGINVSVWTGYVAGTSASTPYTAAMYADVLSQHSFLKRHPELVKALILSSEKIPIANGTTYDSDNGTKAAKGIPTYSSVAWNHRFRYWNGSNSCCFDNNDKITFTESVSSGVHYRIAIAWLTSGDYAATYHSVSQDIDLRIKQNGVTIDSSTSANNPFEIVDFTTTSGSDLTIEIERCANSGDDNVILGYSLWNDL